MKGIFQEIEYENRINKRKHWGKSKNANSV